jgi:large subunit ribosomal protein L4e
MSSLSRPLVRVFDSANADQVSGKIALPAVFNAPIRIDIVHSVHKDMAKNSRQA